MEERDSRVARNIVFRAVGYVLGTALFFLTFVLIARYLGAESFGYFSYVMAVVAVFQILSEMGVTRILVREISKDKENFKKHLATGHLLLWIQSAISLSVVFLIAFLFPMKSELRYSFCVAGVAVLFVIHGLGYSSVLRAFEEMGLDICGFVFHKVAFISFTFLVTRTDLGIIGIFLALLASNVCLWLYYMSLVSLRHGRARVVWDLKDVRPLLREAYPLGVADIVGCLMRVIDKLLLGILSTPVALGIFSVVYKFFESIAPLAMTITLPLLPVFSRLAQISTEHMYQRFAQGFKFLLIAALPLCVFLFVFSEKVILLSFGHGYVEGALGLRILSVAALFSFFTPLFGYFLTALGHQRMILFCMAMALVFNLILDLFLIPRWDAEGAAIAKTLSQALLFLAFLFVWRKRGTGRNLLHLSWRPLLAGLVMGALCWRFQEGSPLSICGVGILSLFLYLLLLLILRALTQEERTWLVGLLPLKVRGRQRSGG